MTMTNEEAGVRMGMIVARATAVNVGLGPLHESVFMLSEAIKGYVENADMMQLAWAVALLTSAPDQQRHVASVLLDAMSEAMWLIGGGNAKEKAIMLSGFKSATLSAAANLPKGGTLP